MEGNGRGGDSSNATPVAVSSNAVTIKQSREGLTPARNKGAVGDDAAKKLLDEAIAMDDAEAKSKALYVPKVIATLPATKAARAPTTLLIVLIVIPFTEHLPIVLAH